MKLFVSYSRDDTGFVYELVKELRDKVDHNAWIDRELSGGQLWWDTILDNIEACACVIIFLTPLSIASAYCAAELSYALALRKVILPLLLKRCDLPQALREIQYIDISSLSLNEAFLRCAQALIRIERDLLLRRGYESQIRPPRPPRPMAEVDTPENISELFTDAAKAANANNIALAESLYQKVMKADSEGLGKLAAERLALMSRQRDRATAYIPIVRLAELGDIEGAKVLWQNYAQKYGTDYDPNHYLTTLFSTKGLQETTPPTPTIETYVRDYQVQTGLIFSPPQHIQTHPEGPSMPPQDVGTAFAEPAMLLQSVQVDQTHPARGSVPQAREETQPPPTQEMVSHKGGKPMRLIPASQFIYGNGEFRELPDFYIDTWPVTNEEYRQFLVENNFKAPSTWRGGSFPSEKADHPVTGVSWHEAMAYAKWAGKRLPAAAEWEKAARGKDGRRYPWGDSFDIQRCNTAESSRGKRDTTTPVMQYLTSASVYGVLDMAGNVWEWTLDEVKPRGMGRHDQETKRVLKGGSWKTPRGSADCVAYTSAWPTEQFDDIGFRCVQSKIELANPGER